MITLVSRDRDSVLFITALDYASPFESYELRVKCVELGRPAREVMENDLRVAESYHHTVMQLTRARQEELKLAREETERRRREMEERWAAGRRREREEYYHHCHSSLRQLVSRDTNSGKVR